ncbi:hypothetical protein B0I37DRAFT_375169 [Chaetomium sp. MPI-CAGE-AT-0009]|nr:hypothetical protein B0I37DRAFT_375169 [Chaetomium sp. MPI-CAGE-AT-0009]
MDSTDEREEGPRSANRSQASQGKFPQLWLCSASSGDFPRECGCWPLSVGSRKVLKGALPYPRIQKMELTQDGAKDEEASLVLASASTGKLCCIAQADNIARMRLAHDCGASGRDGGLARSCVRLCLCTHTTVGSLGEATIPLGSASGDEQHPVGKGSQKTVDELKNMSPFKNPEGLAFARCVPKSRQEAAICCRGPTEAR